MGNTESNTRQRNYKVFKITHVENNKDNKYIKVYLHDYVTYQDGNYKHVYLEKDWPDYFFTKHKEGDYLAIDLNATSRETSAHDFSTHSGTNYYKVKRIGKDEVIEKRDSNGNFEGFFYKAAEFLSGMQDARERRYAIMEDARNSNYANLRQTSYNMPPKW